MTGHRALHRYASGASAVLVYRLVAALSIIGSASAVGAASTTAAFAYDEGAIARVSLSTAVESLGGAVDDLTDHPSATDHGYDSVGAISRAISANTNASPGSDVTGPRTRCRVPLAITGRGVPRNAARTNALPGDASLPQTRHGLLRTSR
jgi:hypothetical protein